MSAVDVKGLSASAQKVVFINHVDCFQTGFIAKHLSSSVVGITQMEQEIQDEMEEEIRLDQVAQMNLSDLTYKIIGTLSDPQSQKPHFVHAILQNKNLQEMFQGILDCDIFIYDITCDPSQNAEAIYMANKIAENMLKIDTKIKKTFIIISSILTWASTPSSDPGDIRPIFMDENFRKRRPHKNYRHLYSSEKELLQCGRTKKNLNTYVIAPGLVYGAKEEIFHYIFKATWMNEPKIPLIGQGDNFLPTIHIEDLAKVVQYLIDKNPRKFNYILAIDQAQYTLKDITKAVNQVMGSGVIEIVPPENALSIPDMIPMFIDLLTLDLRMVNPVLLDTLKFKWTSPMGIIEYINQVIEEFKTERKLKPLKLVMLGPPGTGKTTLTRMLQDSHKLHQIRYEDVQTKIINDLMSAQEGQRVMKSTLSMKAESQAKSVEFAEEEETDEVEPADEKERGLLEDYRDLLTSIERDLGERQMPPETIDESYVIKALKLTLLSKPFQNQGFIIDGFPVTGDHVGQLFGTIDDVRESREQPDNRSRHAAILPDLVVKLDADDEFLKARIRDLPAALVEGTNNEEKAFLARLEQYRKLNTVESSIEDFLDELEFNISYFDVSTDQSGISADILSSIKILIGPPRTYGPSKEELEMLMHAASELRMQQDQQSREEEERQLAEEESVQNDKKLLWNKRHYTVQSELKELNEVQSLPLRHYLFQHVMPSLLVAMTECCSIMPDDPVDYLAEYLLKYHPEVD